MASPALRRAYLELCYRPVSARQIASATRLVGEIFGEPIGEPDAISRVTLAVHEILENLAKYAAEGVPTLCVELSEDGDAGLIEIRTRNRASRERLALTEQLLQSLICADDPRETYRELMARTAAQAEGSGLGLARIRAEAELQFSFEIAADSVEITAFGRVPLQPRRPRS
jgi:hypothetical protein